MRRNILTAAIGIALAAAFVPLSATDAQAADPTGYWRKAEQGKYPAKMQLYRCGGRSICVKIVWLQNPRDSQGRILQDVRNQNPKLRGRTIEGLPIVRGMAQASANSWKGSIYNPEDGKTYSATITLASNSKIVLRGCVAAFLCREQVWLRTSAPPPKVEEKPDEEQIEASAEPEAAPIAASAAASQSLASTGTEMLTPADGQTPQAGYRYLNASTSNEGQAGFTGDNVNSMFSMAKPIEAGGTQAPSKSAAAESALAPAPKPIAELKPGDQPKPVEQPNIAEQPAPAPQPRASASAEPEARPAPQPAAEPEPVEQAEDQVQTQTADAESEANEKLTWRERRQLRRQRRLRDLQAQGQQLIPWLR